MWTRVRDAALFLLFLAVAFYVATAEAQVSQGGHNAGSGPLQRGHFLKPEQYATQAALALFVDPTGSDSNACTASGTSACLTIQGAMNKIPFLVNHPVTVDIAAGSYAGFLLMNHSFAPTDTTTGAYISIRGAAQTNVTPASGSATGTIASVATDAVGFHVVTVTAAGWTVNDFSGRFLSLTGGTGSGQVLPIISNTATTITVAGTFSPAPVGASTTFAVTSPSVLLTSAANLPAGSSSAAGNGAGMNLINISTPRAVSNFVNIQDIGQNGNFRFVNVINVNSYQLVRVRCNVATAVLCLSQAGLSHTQITASAMLGSTGAGLVFAGGAPPFGPAADATLTNVYATSSAGATVSQPNYQVNITVQTSELVSTSTADEVIDLRNGSASLVVSGSRLRCGAASSNSALLLTSAQSNTLVPPGPHTASFIGTNSVETCTNGIFVNGPGQVVHVGSATTLLSNTTGVKATGGGTVAFFAVPVFTTNTTDINVDGSTFTRAAFVALVPNSVVDANYQSAVYLIP